MDRRTFLKTSLAATAAMSIPAAGLSAATDAPSDRRSTMQIKTVKLYENGFISHAFIMGGETIVHLTGHGKGGRNQELALAAAPGISGFPGTAVFSVGSDGTDGPTDAAGG